MADHQRSSLLSALLVVVLIGVGQLFKGTLADSRPGTLIGGGIFKNYFNSFNSLHLGIGSLVFVFTLTAISNLKMSGVGVQAKSGLGEVIGALLFGVIVAASIHRVSATISILFSLGLLVFLTGIFKILIINF